MSYNRQMKYKQFNNKKLSEFSGLNSYFDLTQGGGRDNGGDLSPVSEVDLIPLRIKLNGGDRFNSTQLDLNLFSSSNLNDLIFKELFNYPYDYHTTVRNIIKCGRKYRVDKCSVPDCEFCKKTIFTCQNRYCPCERCSNVRLNKARRRLNNWAWPKWTRRFYHFTIGSDKLSKKELDNVVTKFIRNMRHGDKRLNHKRRSYKLNYIKVFDIGQSGKYFHYHIAILPEFSSAYIPRFMDDSTSVLNRISDNVIFNNIGFRRRVSILDYFAKRSAGILGHKNPGYYYYSDVMPLNSYLDTFYLSKNLTYSLPNGLVYNNVPSFTTFLCEIHNIPLQFYCFETIDTSILNEKELINTFIPLAG
jgi:hypothetical protein